MEDVVIPDTIEAHPEEIWFENYLFISNDHLNPSPLIWVFWLRLQKLFILEESWLDHLNFIFGKVQFLVI